MGTDLCARCGRPLQDGRCPKGHPQRAARTRRRRRIPRAIPILLVILLLLGAGAYAALIWYPVRAAEGVMRPTSQEYAEALADYREVVEAYPAADDPEALGQASSLLDLTDDARSSVAEGRVALEERILISLPVISSRPALDTAERARTRILSFYEEGATFIGDLESVARYLAELEGVLPTLGNLRSALRIPRSPGEVTQIVAAARPIAEQLQADTRSLSPPDPLLETHAALLAVAVRIRTDIDEIERASEEGVAPVLAALVEGIRSQLDTYAQTSADAPQSALEAGPEEQIAALDGLADRINGLLRALRAQGVEGLTVPG